VPLPYDIFSVSDRDTVRKILNEWFPGTRVDIDPNFRGMMPMLVIHYPEATFKIALAGSKLDIADRIAHSSKRYRVLFVEHEELHTDTGGYDF
jgi:hypothetical protein